MAEEGGVGHHNLESWSMTEDMATMMIDEDYGDDDNGDDDNGNDDDIRDDDDDDGEKRDDDRQI